jgi:hypothetical protein
LLVSACPGSLICNELATRIPSPAICIDASLEHLNYRRIIGGGGGCRVGAIVSENNVDGLYVRQYDLLAYTTENGTILIKV